MASRRPSSPVERSAGCIFGSMPALGQEHFVYNQSVNVEEYVDVAVSRIAAAIGEPARARMLYCLLDGHARTSTELAMVADESVNRERTPESTEDRAPGQGAHSGEASLLQPGRAQRGECA